MWNGRIGSSGEPGGRPNSLKSMECRRKLLGLTFISNICSIAQLLHSMVRDLGKLYLSNNP